MPKTHKDHIDFLYNFKLFVSLLRPYWPLAAMVLGISFIIEASSTLDKIFFKILIDRAGDMSIGQLTQNDYVKLLLSLLIAFGIILLLRSIGKWFHLHFVVKLEVKIIYDLKVRFFSHLIGLSHEFHTTHKAGSMISRFSRGAKATESISDIIIFQFVPLLFQLGTVSLGIIYFSWISAVVVVLTVVSFISYSWLIQSLQQSWSLADNDADDLEKGLIGDVFSNVDAIKYYGKESLISERYQVAAKRTQAAQRSHWNFFRLWDFGQTLILGLGTLMVVLFPILAFLKHEMSLGTVVFIFTLFGNMIAPMFSFVQGLRQFYRGMADFETLFRYARIKNSIPDRPQASLLVIKKGEVTFENISFQYQRRNVFKNFSLTIKAKEHVALVGRSGSGKTTLMKLLYRFYDVDEGAVMIDGENIKSFQQESLRGAMSIVPQDCVLFDDSIYNNVAFSNPKATRQEVINALKFAQLDKVIAHFPEKENTIVGERGVKLSGGEKQRVSIARAILAKTKLVILDEATSALDSKTEQDIQTDLAKLLKGKTAIIIAHRLSTIMRADRIVVMEQGEMVQVGTHKELIKKKGVYQNLWNLQKNGYIL